jgi:hypothetical protein
MKKYVAPEINCVELRADERVCTCTYYDGACSAEYNTWVGLNS